MTDNTTAVAYLLRQYSYQSALLIELHSILVSQFQDKITLFLNTHEVIPGLTVLQVAPGPCQKIGMSRWTCLPPVKCLSDEFCLPSLGPLGGRGERPVTQLGILVALFQAKAAWFPMMATNCQVQVPLQQGSLLVTSRGKEYYSYP